MAFGLHFSPWSRAELVDHVASEPIGTGGGAHILCTANLDHIVRLRENPALRAAYDEAWCVTADGMPVFAYLRLKRERVPERVTGADVVQDLVRCLVPGRARCFFMVSCQATADGLRALLRGRGFADDALVFVVPPFGFERDAAWSAAVLRRIRGHGTTHLFLGVGAPKSEIWTHQHKQALGDCYVLNAGAGLDYACGVRRRAPLWMQRTGLEWAWRVGAEPGRLFKRYFLDSWGFLSAILADLSAERALARRGHLPQA